MFLFQYYILFNCMLLYIWSQHSVSIVYVHHGIHIQLNNATKPTLNTIQRTNTLALSPNTLVAVLSLFAIIVVCLLLHSLNVRGAGWRWWWWCGMIGAEYVYASTYTNLLMAITLIPFLQNNLNTDWLTDW